MTYTQLTMKMRFPHYQGQTFGQPRSQDSLLPALRSMGRVGENLGNEVDIRADLPLFQARFVIA